MSGPASRMLRLLSLLQTRRDWSGEELAERLGVSTRTVRRDIDRLRELGYPVAAAPGVDGGYHLEAGGALPPLLIDDEEAVALALGLRTAAASAVAGIEEASLRALGKLEHILPSRLRRRVSALHTYTVPLNAPSAGVDPEVLAAITLACRDLERLRFRYRAYDGATTRRMSEPHTLVAAGRRWYLVAWDVDRADWRTFRVDRLDELQHTAVRFRPRPLPGGDAAAFVAEAIQAPFTTHPAVVRFHAPASTVAERVPRSAGTLEPDGEDACVLHTTTDSFDWLASLLGLVGVDFQIVEPEELIDVVRDMGARLTRAARSGGPLN